MSSLFLVTIQMCPSQPYLQGYSAREMLSEDDNAAADTTSTTAMQMQPLLAVTSVAHRGAQCLLTFVSLTQSPLGSVPSACVLVFECSLYINRVENASLATYGGLCGMPACRQAVGCGVCDTPELWRGAAGLCVRVYARVLVPPNLYIHT